MAKKNAPVAIPKEALPDGESNSYVAKFKSSLSKRWTLTRMETLYEISDLAMFLWALERSEEAIAVASSIASAIPGPPALPRGGFNYNLWCPATFSHGLVVHLSTDRRQSNASRAAIMLDPGIARTNPASIADDVQEARDLAAAPGGQDTIKWECQHFARALGSMVLYCELAKAGDEVFKPHLNEAADIIPQLLARLATRLRSAK